MMVNYRTTGDIKKYRYIKSQLILQGIEIQDIAKDVGVSPTMVGFVVAGKRKSLRVRKAIARKLRMDITDIWPDETRHLKASKGR
jgi:lambda repressor-like predicted transcriptional regulator